MTWRCLRATTQTCQPTFLTTNDITEAIHERPHRRPSVNTAHNRDSSIEVHMDSVHEVWIATVCPIRARESHIRGHPLRSYTE